MNSRSSNEVAMNSRSSNEVAMNSRSSNEVAMNSRSSNDISASSLRCANDPDLLFHGQVEFEYGADDSDDEWGVADTSGSEPVEHAFTFRRSRGSESNDVVLEPEPEAEICEACGG